MSLRVVLVEYHNTLPFLSELNKYPGEFKVIRKHPSACAQWFSEGKADLALVPLASFLGMENVVRVSDYGIATKGIVRTVKLMSHTGLEHLKKVYLDHQSETSVRLLKIILKKKKFSNIIFERAEVKGLKLNEGEGVLMIGDKVFDHEKDFQFQWDLGEEWKELTSLPFVFAVWVARVGFDKKMEKRLNQIFKIGIDEIQRNIDNWTKLSKFDLSSYFQENIWFEIGENEVEAMEKYRMELELLE